MIIRVNVYFWFSHLLTARGTSKETPPENRRKRIEGKENGEKNKWFQERYSKINWNKENIIHGRWL